MIGYISYTKFPILELMQFCSFLGFVILPKVGYKRDKKEPFCMCELYL